MAYAVLVATATIALFGQSFAGSNFLAVPKVKIEDLEADLLTELAGAASNSNASATASHLATLEAALRPMFAAVPKEEDGTLGHNVVRYVLQRFFAHQHGWFIRGLEPNQGSSANATLDANGSQQSLQDWAPAYLQGFLETMMTGSGVSLRELAVYAATLQDLVHKEEKGNLRQAYANLDQSTDVDMEQEKAFQVFETYMMIYMLNGNWTAQMASQVPRLRQLFSKKVSHWDETLDWLRQLLKETTTSSGESGKLDFDGATGLVAEIGNRFASFNTAECGRLKSALITTESAKPGRVRLVDFYKMGLQGAWEFNEKIDFLRDIGTLDESDPSTPLVILPNYVQARSNCLAVSSFYAVCCPNECEGLMQTLEAEIVGSTARPSRIAKIVSKLSSATVQAPRTLSKVLMQRLQSIASHHGGEVPLHGRLFAQWMHHAFPRECVFPQAGGTASAQTADEWVLTSGQADSTLTKEEMQAEIESDTCRLLPKGVECNHHGRTIVASHGAEDEELPWDSSEELLIVRSSPPAQVATGAVSQNVPLRPLNDIMLWCALLFMVSSLGWAFKATNAGRRLSLWAGVPLSTSVAKPVMHFA